MVRPDNLHPVALSQNRLFATRLSADGYRELALAFCRKAYPIEALLKGLQTRSEGQVEQQRAGFLLLHVHRTCPRLLDGHLALLVDLLDGPEEATHHASYPRQAFSVLQDRPLAEAIAGRVFAKAVDYYLDRSLDVAVRVRALDAARNVATQYPGLWPEVRELAQLVGEEDRPGLRSLAGRILRAG